VEEVSAREGGSYRCKNSFSEPEKSVYRGTGYGKVMALRGDWKAVTRPKKREGGEKREYGNFIRPLP